MGSEENDKVNEEKDQRRKNEKKDNMVRLQRKVLFSQMTWD